MLGIYFQVLWLGYMPLGAVRFTDGNMAAFISSSSLFMADKFFSFSEIEIRAAMVPVLVIALSVGALGNYMRNVVRHFNGKRSEMLLDRIETGKYPSLALRHFTGVGFSFLRGIVMTLLVLPAGTILCGMVIHLPDRVNDGLAIASLVMWGTVAASAIMFYSLHGRKRFLILGAFGGFIWFLTTILL
ncbi:hypothetical protein ES708_29779 [subsurface metagenome]